MSTASSFPTTAGRQLDGALPPLDALPPIAEAVGNKLPVMLDGGIRRGSDIVKALALGARFVFVGRPFLYAASIGGLDATLLAADILKTELHRKHGPFGLTSLNQIGASDLFRVKGS